jgi:hypothetical protein
MEKDLRCTLNWLAPVRVVHNEKLSTRRGDESALRLKQKPGEH